MSYCSGKDSHCSKTVVLFSFCSLGEVFRTSLLCHVNCSQIMIGWGLNKEQAEEKIQTKTTALFPGCYDLTLGEGACY